MVVSCHSAQVPKVSLRENTADSNPLLYFLQSIKNPLVTGKGTVARGFILLICSRGARDIYPQVTVLKSTRNYDLKAFQIRGR